MERKDFDEEFAKHSNQKRNCALDSTHGGPFEGSHYSFRRMCIIATKTDREKETRLRPSGLEALSGMRLGFGLSVNSVIYAHRHYPCNSNMLYFEI